MSWLLLIRSNVLSEISHLKVLNLFAYMSQTFMNVWDLCDCSSVEFICLVQFSVTFKTKVFYFEIVLFATYVKMLHKRTFPADSMFHCGFMGILRPRCLMVVCWRSNQWVQFVLTSGRRRRRSSRTCLDASVSSLTVPPPFYVACLGNEEIISGVRKLTVYESTLSLVGPKLATDLLALKGWQTYKGGRLFVKGYSISVYSWQSRSA